MKRVQQGFTLIELMIVVAIIGILAAVAIPAYQDYTARAKMTEAITALGAAKVSVAEYAASMGSMPTTAAAAGLQSASSTYVSAIGIKSGATSGTAAIEVTVRGINADVNTKKFELEGVRGSDGSVVWTCKKNEIPEKYLPANCRG